MLLVNAQRKTVLADRCRLADNVGKRMIGLLNRAGLDPGEGLLLDRCYGIHTWFMRFPIDVLFLDKDYRVIKTVHALPAWRACAVPHAVYVLELPAGTIERTLTAEGDQIHLRATAPTPVPAASALKN